MCACLIVFAFAEGSFWGRELGGSVETSGGGVRSLSSADLSQHSPPHPVKVLTLDYTHAAPNADTQAGMPPAVGHLCIIAHLFSVAKAPYLWVCQ
jgi:hypothetical protein